MGVARFGRVLRLISWHRPPFLRGKGRAGDRRPAWGGRSIHGPDRAARPARFATRRAGPACAVDLRRQETRMIPFADGAAV